MYLVTTPVNPVGHPTLRVSKFPLPGDKTVAMLHRVVIDLDTGRVTRLQMPPDYHRATLAQKAGGLTREQLGTRVGASDLTLAGLVNHAAITLHIDNLKGKNAHHQAETIFKAFGRALRVAVERDERMGGVTPSTKGVL